MTDYAASVRIKGEVEIEAQLTHTAQMQRFEQVGISKLLDMVVDKYRKLTGPQEIITTDAKVEVRIKP